MPQNADVIQCFRDALWPEDGLVRSTFDAYRRDLTLYAHWLAERNKFIAEVEDDDLVDYSTVRHTESHASLVSRCHAVFKHLFQWALREHVTSTDLSYLLPTVKQLPRFSKTLFET